MNETSTPVPMIEALGIESEQPEPERDPREELITARKACTPKQRKLLDALAEYDFQPWRAGRELGYGKRMIHAFLRDPKFKAARVLLDEVAVDDMCITNRRILAEYAAIAFADARGMFDAVGKLRKPDEWPAEIASAVAQIETEEHSDGRGEEREFYTVRKLRMHSKLEALKALASYKRLIADRHEHFGPNGEPLSFAPPVIQIMRYEDDAPDEAGSAPAD